MKRLFKNAKLFDGSENVIECGWMLVEADKIEGIGRMDQMPEVAADTETVDLTKQTLLPGLIDAAYADMGRRLDRRVRSAAAESATRSGTSRRSHLSA